MKENFVAFYISDHGFGHMTRCLAIIEYMLNKSDVDIYLVCGRLQNDFAEKYLIEYSGRIIFRNLNTDIGLINKTNSLKIDKMTLEKELFSFVEKFEREIEKEIKYLQHFNLKCIISDISTFGPAVAGKLGVKSIGISNFTWVEQYEHLNMNKQIIDHFENAYSQFNGFIKYGMALPINNRGMSVHNVGLVSRKMNKDRVEELKNKYGPSVFITCGKSATLNNVYIQNYRGCIFTTSGMNVTSQGDTIKLPTNVLDTQNYVAASDLVITKAGWGTIAESLVAHKKLVVIERPDSFEDMYTIDYLKKSNLAISIKEIELNNLDIESLMQRANQMIDEKKLRSFQNDIDSVYEKISLYN